MVLQVGGMAAAGDAARLHADATVLRAVYAGCTMCAAVGLGSSVHSRCLRFVDQASSSFVEGSIWDDESSLRTCHGRTCGWDRNVVLSHLEQTCSCAGRRKRRCDLCTSTRASGVCFCTRLKGDFSIIDRAIMEDEENEEALSEASDSSDEGDLEDASADFLRSLEIEASPS